jgi:hypothetical protein
MMMTLLAIPPAGAVENFKTSSYGAGHQIWFEAEDFDERDPADDSSFALSDEPGAYGRSITCMGGTRGGNMMRYTFDISKTGGSGGTWYFWGRVINPSNRSSFMLVEGNPGDPMPVVMPMGDLPNEFRVFEENAGAAGTWAWSGDNGNESHTKTLQDGENTMYIISRENQAILDLYVWTDDPDYVPTEADYENAKVASKGEASNPSPSGNAQDVPYYTDTLSWTAGEFAVKHNVYFGTDFDDVNAATVDDPRDVLLAEGITETSVSLNVELDLATMYYWRVDEVNAPPDHTIFKGGVWSFEIEPVSYEVVGVSAEASTENDPNMTAAKTVSGAGLDAAGQHSTILEDMWLNDLAEVTGATITYDLGTATMLDRMHVWNHNSQTETILGYGIKEALIETSADGASWTELKTVELPQASGTGSYRGADVALDNAVARYLRITALSNYSILGLTQVGLAEVRFYNIPVASRELSPAQGMTLDALQADLSWRSGRFTAEHQVLLSDDRDAVEDGSAVIATTADRNLTVADLALNGEYFWQIVDLAEDGTAYPGAIQSFTVAGSLAIDDMEMYKAEEGLFIWEHWIDGFENNDNGSVVGNGDEPERTVVYEGSQSLPMAFDNTAAPVSEATRFFDAAVDLTAGQADSLQLHVRGDAPGFLEGADGSMTVGAAGVDIWGTADDFRFVHKKLSGDGSITARIDSCTQADVWTKAGVMMRANTGDDSTNAFSFITPTGRVGTQWRTETFTDTVSTRSETEGDISLPYWVRLTRIGNLFKGEQSADGVNWQPMFQSGSPDLPTEREIITIPDLHVGLAVTSHQAGASAVAVFSEVTITGNVTGAWTSDAVGADNHPDNDAAPIYLRLTDTTGQEKTFDHPNPEATVLMDWDAWEIPLDDLSPVNPAKLDAITIGVGGSAVSGKVYVDYIHSKDVPVSADPGTEGLVAHFAFEGDSADGSGNGLDGTLTDGEFVDAGMPGLGTALRLNGAGNVDLGNPALLDFATEDWTVAAWFNTVMTGTGDDNKGAIYAKGGDSGGGHRIALILSETTEGAVSLVCDDDATKAQAHATSITNDGEWHHVAGQRRGTGLNLYIDGVLEATNTVSAGYDLSGTVQHNAYIGAVTNNGDGTLYKVYAGLVDEVRVYHRALSEGEVVFLSGQ